MAPRFSDSLADVAERFSVFLKKHGLHFQSFAAHLRLDILTPREAWALRKFAPICGGAGTGFINDLKNQTVSGISIAPITASGTLTGTAVDMVDSDGPCFGIVNGGAISGGTTAATFAVKYTECDTSGGTYADITGATHATISTASQLSIINFKRSKRYIKAVATATGTSPTLVVGVTVLGVKKAT